MPLRILPHIASAVISATITKKFIDHPLYLPQPTQVPSEEETQVADPSRLTPPADSPHDSILIHFSNRVEVLS